MAKRMEQCTMTCRGMVRCRNRAVKHVRLTYSDGHVSHSYHCQVHGRTSDTRAGWAEDECSANGAPLLSVELVKD